MQEGGSRFHHGEDTSLDAVDFIEALMCGGEAGDGCLLRFIDELKLEITNLAIVSCQDRIVDLNCVVLVVEESN